MCATLDRHALTVSSLLLLQVDGVSGSYFVGVGVIVDKELGLVIVDRTTVQVALGDVMLTFNGSEVSSCKGDGFALASPGMQGRTNGRRKGGGRGGGGTWEQGGKSTCLETLIIPRANRNTWIVYDEN